MRQQWFSRVRVHMAKTQRQPARAAGHQADERYAQEACSDEDQTRLVGFQLFLSVIHEDVL